MNKEMEIKIYKEDPAYNIFKNRKDIVILSETEHIETMDSNRINKRYVVLTYKEKKTLKVFLTGSIYKSNWREKVVHNVKNIDFLNTPSDDNWEKKGLKKIEEEKKESDYILYVITNLNSYKSMFDVMADAEVYGNKMLYCFDDSYLSSKVTINDFDKFRLEWLKGILTIKNVTIYSSLDDVIEHLKTLKI